MFVIETAIWSYEFYCSVPHAMDSELHGAKNTGMAVGLT
jgi:hypothetical protein